MPIARDASTPAAVLHNDGTPTTASFTPPVGSRLLVLFFYETAGSTPTVTSSGLTFTAVGGTTQANLRAWVSSIVGAATSRTVACDDGNSGFGGQGELVVHVFTGVDTTTPIGTTANGSSTTNQISVGYTSTTANSLGVGLGRTGTPNGVCASTDTVDANPSLFVGGGLMIRKAATTTTPGTSVTFDFDANGTGATTWQWMGIEVSEAGGGGGPVFVADPPLIVNQAALIRANYW